MDVEGNEIRIFNRVYRITSEMMVGKNENILLRVARISVGWTGGRDR